MLVFPASYSLGFWLVFLHMMSWGILWSPSLGSKSHGFFWRKCKNGKRISIGSLDSDIFWHEKWGGAAKSKFDFHPFMLIKHALIFLFQLLGGCLSVPKKPSKKTNVMFQLEIPGFSNSRCGVDFAFFWYGKMPSLRISSHCHLPMVGFRWSCRSPSICFGTPLKMMRFRSTCGVRYDTLEIRCFFFFKWETFQK